MSFARRMLTTNAFRGVARSVQKDIRVPGACVGQKWALSRQYATEGETKAEPQEGVEVKSLKEQVENLMKQVEEKDKKLSEMKDNYLRALAEAENVRNRAQAQLENNKKFAVRKFSKELLDTVDVLAMAIKNIPENMGENSDIEKVHESAREHAKAVKDLSMGINLTLKNLLKAFERHGVVQFNPIDQKFDPNTSDAVYQVPVPGKTPGHVFVVEKTGFMIHDSVLRPAQVGVVSEQPTNKN
ncbi:hypothetical protein BB560_003066 [Smittium megazygosporum]|uniref:GrpE protein homolog, mitochondrial n=1 Tax=Smittium megazygosporum TaxID=133381 RepID=A0A2T9ZD55_9FUNG|nr:hypothetical protein BB560_003066 [Smittium megazygosporum]